MGWIIACVAVVSCPIVSSLQGQVVFSSTTRPVNFQGYTSVWDCLAAIQRIGDSISDANALWLDTLPIGMVPRDSMSPVIGRAARDCGARATDADLHNDVRQWVTLILLRSGNTGLDDVMRSFAPVLSTADSVRQRIVGEVANAYVQDPLLVLPAISHWRDALVQRASSLQAKAKLWRSYMWAARERQDTLTAEYARQEILAVGLDTTTADGENLQLVQHARGVNDARGLLDSLRAGGSASYLRAFASGSQSVKQSDEWKKRIGMDAPPLNLPVWIPTRPDGQFPALGKTTMLVFVDNQSYGGIKKPHGSFAALRRITERFPELEIVFVARTLGWFGEGPPLSVAEEGEAISKWLFEHHRLRGRLAVDSTPFYRMPGLDRRRVYLPSEMDLNYKLGTATRYEREYPDDLKGGPFVVLVSANRKIIECGRIGNVSEPRYVTFIEALLKENTR